MRLKIWGCRGSIPAPGPGTVTYGGNTSCVEVSLDNGAVFVLDAGTGIRELGADLHERGTRRIHLLLTHLHLDHLEGIRFFAPLFDEQVKIDVWGPSSPVQSLRERIRRSFSPPLFPIDLRETPAQLTFHDVPKKPWTVEGATLVSALVMHPGPTVGFRIEADGASFAYLPDHEPALTGKFAERSRDWISGASIAEDVDLLLHDSQFFDDEYAHRVGWGHSSVESAVAYAHAVGARRLVLFHHDPHHADRALERLEVEAASLSSERDEPPMLAREGMVLELPRR
jgi:phosphoribosyl 1,2-cyclic phosphodiesterase